MDEVLCYLPTGMTGKREPCIRERCSKWVSLKELNVESQQWEDKPMCLENAKLILTSDAVQKIDVLESRLSGLGFEMQEVKQAVQGTMPTALKIAFASGHRLDHQEGENHG